MAAGARYGQVFFCLLITVLSIIACCSTPTARNISILSATKRTSDAMDPNANFNGLVMGIRGFCNGNKCSTYADYSSNGKKVAKRMKLDKYANKAVLSVAGKNKKYNNSSWYVINNLSIISAATAFFTLIVAAIMATMVSQTEKSGMPVNTSMIKIILIVLSAACFILHISTWGYLYNAFDKAKSALEQNRNKGVWGTAFWLLTVSWVANIFVLALEAFAHKSESMANNMNGQYMDSNQGYV